MGPIFTEGRTTANRRFDECSEQIFQGWNELLLRRRMIRRGDSSCSAQASRSEYADCVLFHPFMCVATFKLCYGARIVRIYRLQASSIRVAQGKPILIKSTVNINVEAR